MSRGDQPWSVLSRLDAGSWHSRAWAGEPLPTLDNVARFCRRNDFFLNIEIKPTPGVEQHTGEVVAREAARLWAWRRRAAAADVVPARVVAGCAHHRAAPAARAAAGHAVERLDGCRTRTGMRRASSATTHLWDRDTVAQVQGAGLRCLSYTVNDEWAAQRLIDLGTDGIITDRVDLFAPA